MIPVFDLELNGREKEYVLDCLNNSEIGSFGIYTNKFETEFSKFINREYSSFCSSGSAAIELVAMALNFNSGDEVIFPAFTIISCIQPFIRRGVKPVLADCNSSTYNIEASALEQLITSKTKAIFIAHIYGLTCEMDEIEKLAEKYNLLIIEDAAESIGQNYKDRICGSFGLISIFSFYANKHVTCGEGGMVSTNNKSLIDKINYYKNLCFGKDRFIHEEMGYNYRATNIQAAIGLAQLEKIDETIKMKKHIGNHYQNCLEGFSETIRLPIKKTSYCENIYWVFPIQIKSLKSKAPNIRKKLLNDFKIDTRPFFFPLNKQPVFKRLGLFKNIQMPISEKLYENGFYLPSGLNLKDDQIEYISDSLLKCIE